MSKFDPSGTQLIYSTYLGGSKYENPNSLAIGSDGSASESAGNIWAGGSTTSHDFFTVSVFQGLFAGGPFDAFFTKISADPIQPEQ